MVDFFLDMFEKVQRERQDDIINGLKGKMNFHEFKRYFASFIFILENGRPYVNVLRLNLI